MKMTDNIKPNTAKTALVDKAYHWRKITPSTPRGVKLQLINRPAGVACQGSLGTHPGFWTHWCPLPTFDPNEELS